jgi:4-hydroxythreonine-4-phosphate dehydrogenase
MTARLALSIGCPSGIGPEVSVAAAGAMKADARVLLVGAHDVIARAAKVTHVDAARLVRVAEPADAWALSPGLIGTWSPPLAGRSPAVPGRPRPADGAAQLAWIDAACDLASSGAATAMVTGPVSKDVIASSGAPRSKHFLGHTEHLQRRLRAEEVVMAFWNERFTTALVTTHLPLARVARAITTESVACATFWLAKLLVQLGDGASRPRIAVCGLNPHAGEAGRLGREEITAVAPGIAAAKVRLGAARRAVVLEGPVPAETAFRKAARDGGAYEGVVAMYHDQATIPMKLVGFGESVNVSLGLPIVRTSVDHGTGYDIAGKGVADPRGMREAIALAVRLGPGRASPVSDARGRTRSARG